MGRPSKRIRRRSASYYSGSAKVVSSNTEFSVYAKGFSFTFSHNWNNWFKYANSQKKRMATLLRKKVEAVSQLIAEEARKRCPHYSGALEEAIAVSAPSVEGGITARGYIEMAVGVLPSWRSAYDKYLNESGYSNKPMSSPSLAMYIHEFYDTFIYDEKNKEGLERKRRKEAITGRVVGSHFLNRAYTESNDKIRAIFTTWRGYRGSNDEVPF